MDKRSSINKTIATFLFDSERCIIRQYSPKFLSAEFSLNNNVYTLLLYLYNAQS